MVGRVSRASVVISFHIDGTAGRIIIVATAITVRHSIAHEVVVSLTAKL